MGRTVFLASGIKTLIPAPSRARHRALPVHGEGGAAPRFRGVIAPGDENCMVCMLCASSCSGPSSTSRAKGDGRCPPARRQALHGHWLPGPLRHRPCVVHVLGGICVEVCLRSTRCPGLPRRCTSSPPGPAEMTRSGWASGWRPPRISSPTRPGRSRRSGKVPQDGHDGRAEISSSTPSPPPVGAAWYGDQQQLRRRYLTVVLRGAAGLVQPPFAEACRYPGAVHIGDHGADAVRHHADPGQDRATST